MRFRTPPTFGLTPSHSSAPSIRAHPQFCPLVRGVSCVKEQPFLSYPPGKLFMATDHPQRLKKQSAAIPSQRWYRRMFNRNRDSFDSTSCGTIPHFLCRTFARDIAVTRRVRAVMSPAQGLPRSVPTCFNWKKGEETAITCRCADQSDQSRFTIWTVQDDMYCYWWRWAATTCYRAGDSRHGRSRWPRTIHATPEVCTSVIQGRPSQGEWPRNRARGQRSRARLFLAISFRTLSIVPQYFDCCRNRLLKN
jgi:hypothetical protein